MTGEVDLRGRVIDGRYRVIDRLGRGGMGSVFLAQHTQSHERFALKVLHPEVARDPMMVERFVREARAAAAFRSKHVVKIVDAQRDHVGPDGEPMPYLVMELLEGANLEAIIARRGALPPAEVVWFTRQVGKALDLAHERGIVHRDLKPENLFVALDEEGTPTTKVCDFGIAKLVGEGAAGLLATGALSTGESSLGTPMYMSPEQIRNSATVDARTDQWALALIAFKALTGREYFADATSRGNLMAVILVDPIVAPSTKGCTAGAAFDEWFLKSCSRDPAARWETVGAQVSSLQEALAITTPHPIEVPKDTTALETAATGAAPAAPATPPEVLPTGAPATTTHGVLTDTRTRNRRLAVSFGVALTAIAGLAAFARFGGAHEPTLSATGSASAAASTIDSEGGSAGVLSARRPIGSATSAPSATPQASIAPVPVVIPPPVTTSVASAVASAAPVSKPKTKPAGPSASAPPVPTPSIAPPAPKTKLPPGAACSRGGECASGYCFAEQCQ